MKLTDLPKLNTKREQALNKSGIHTVNDLLYYFPRRYIDKSNIKPIQLLSQSDDAVSVVGKVDAIQVQGYKQKRRLEIRVTDGSGSVKAVWFRGWKYVVSQIKEGDLVSLFGKTKRYGQWLSMAHPDLEVLESKNEVEKYNTLIPIYPSGKHFSKAYITHKLIASWADRALDQMEISEFLPDQLLSEHGFKKIKEALRTMHQSQSEREARETLERFKYEEFFLFELAMARIKYKQRAKSDGPELKPGSLTKSFFNDLLPFELTEGQKSALGEIRDDVATATQMNRLIQGDVGAGKTVVAIGAMLMAVDSGYQATMMAPTEILAEQHFHTLQNFLKPLGLNIRLLVGGQKKSLREDILTDISGGNCNIAVGTHAIIQEQVNFHKLGLAVIDEQHRFGVKQRTEMLQKGSNPHLLVMSATPIPRSLAMTVYSDLDISVIKDLPGGRKPIKTAVRTDREREQIHRFLESTIAEGGRVYVVYPLIEESEALDLKDATMGFEKLKRRFPDIPIGLLHGRMKAEEKESVMSAFAEGRLSMLVATTVVEVGVDVPEANVMIIEHAERFGLSQLHQLRGRIGRGTRQSYCILMPDRKLSESGRFRLKKMVETTDGFEIAEADLKLRGPGDFLGTKQSGLPEFKYGDIVDDRLLLEQAKSDAWNIIKHDPELEQDKHSQLKPVFFDYFKKRAEYFDVG
ncbi:ATP-dependent DNA helicase RecG [Rhodohalobacter sp. SW132]|uniref:ATP-dependent DNA helicase RecG n=1 Tax=Rhodohalobacter sp. SW132 TaxID=2293433 RepID=UPI000E23B480|nr:ATP-dependent DNA helicase RecG [Rhodohalobacter sp. SW132]REL24607.1 ATP-dependent DNA helicase RecG [Rhodohalobacter sp. SW132]